MKTLLAALVVLLGAQGPLTDPQEEARAQDLMREIRCVACENEPISNSSSDIAADMRERVRAMVAEGRSDAEIRSWFSERYGEFVLFRPPARGVRGLLLWGAPFLFLLVGGVIAFVLSRRRNAAPADVQPVKPEEAGPPR